MREPRAAELVMGSVQLGLPYGAANRTGKPSHASALRLVRRAADAGVTQFDTARAYGDSEDRLGEALQSRKSVRTITKLSPLSDLAADATRQEVRAAVDASVDQSLKALKRDRLDCLLLHRGVHMTAFGGAVWERLVERLEDGSVLSLGVSVQSPQEALKALDCPDVRHIQMPFNILDWRWREANVIARIRERSCLTVHARSVYLQGILAADDPAVWPSIDGANPKELIRYIDAFVCAFGRDGAADLCLAYARGQDWIDGVVVGMENEHQLEENLRLSVRRPLERAACEEIDALMPRVPVALLDPAQWPAK
ncbi:MAG: aldo/keto reductase [Proteobacteria bacterium]|nr:aldo/keto reductase [Pseudomonadota bacterium]